MDRIIINGGKPLSGRIPISGAKNAALTLMPCALLTDEPLTLRNLPRLADVDSFGHLLNQLGVSTAVEGARKGEFGRVMTFRAANITASVAPYDIVRKMRASILVLGPLLARTGEATVSLPGGCAIGTRPIDLHLKALQALGAEIELAAGYVKAIAPKGGLTGGTISFPSVSVGATENALMAAVLAKGTTIIENAAREPEITDLASCLIAMGAEIEGLRSDTLTVHGKESLHGATYSVMPDRIEAGTILVAAAATRGSVTLRDAPVSSLDAVLDRLRDAGAEIETGSRTVRMQMASRPRAVSVKTAPHPGFPTDMQAQFIALNSVAEGAAHVTENIFENRFMHVQELRRLGAHIDIEGNTAMVHGVPRLTGATVMATDLRASASLVIGGLVADGGTVIDRIYHLDRGYERIEKRLAQLGAQIRRVD
jgi:UDP-N-acetylglucosamine 1-carboxyvinyltransferase